MTVYLRPDSDVYSYDFHLEGARYSGSTDTSDIDEAMRVEQTARDDALSLSQFCRSVIRRARRGRPARPASGFVYVLRSGHFIKIGYSKEPTERFEKICTATPDTCDLLFYLPGDVKLERAMHAEFAGSHHQREWFFLCGKLKRFVAEFERRSMSKPEQKSHGKVPRVAAGALITA